MSEYKKFPWVEYLSSFIFYVVIAALIYVVASVLPQPARQDLTAEQIQQIQQQQQIDQTKQIYNDVLTRVSQLMVIPQTLPEISVINDIQTFIVQNPVFAGAQQGDIVLIYTDRVIVYSPTNNRIVNSVMIPLDVQKKNAEIQKQQQQAQIEQVTTEESPVTVESKTETPAAKAQ